MMLVKPESNSAIATLPPLLSSGQWQERYQIVKSLGHGGFGETYLAIDTHHPDQLQCVIKKLKPFTQSGLANSDETQRRFHREVSALKQLGHHDQIPQLLDHLEDSGELYLVQEFIEGRSLEQELTSNPQNTNSSSWSESQVIQLLQNVLQILAFVHSQGMIHRDIKPSNLIRRQSDGRLVLIDFGAIAPILSESLAPDQLGVTLAIHTEGYTPIEQLRGKPCPASDLYALGMVAIQVLTGLHPREFEETLSLKNSTWFQTTQISAGLIAVLVTMTRRKSSDRYQTAEEALQDLEDLVECSSVEPPRPSPCKTIQHRDAAAIEYTPTQVAASPLPESTPVDSQTADDRVESPLKTQNLKPKTPAPLPTFSPSSTAPISLKRWQRLFTRRLCSLLIAVGLISSGAGLLLWIVAGWQIGESQSTVEASPTPVKFLLNTLTEDSAIEAIAFSDEHTLIGGLANSQAVRWQTTSADSIESFANHFSPVKTVVVSPDGQRLATGSEDSNITLWDLQTGKALQTLRGHQWAVLSLAFSPDAQTLVSSSDDQTIRFWNVTTGKLLHTLTGFQEPFHSIDISGDGSLLVGGSANNTITAWNTHTQEVVRTLRGHSDEVTSVVISPNGAVLVSGSADQTVKVWNLYTGDLLHTLTGHRDAVNAVAVSPNGRLIASGSADQTVKVWDLYSGELIYTFREHTRTISAVAISPDGKTLASASLDGTAKIWEMPDLDVTNR